MFRAVADHDFTVMQRRTMDRTGFINRNQAESSADIMDLTTPGQKPERIRLTYNGPGLIHLYNCSPFPALFFCRRDRARRTQLQVPFVNSKQHLFPLCFSCDFFSICVTRDAGSDEEKTPGMTRYPCEQEMDRMGARFSCGLPVCLNVPLSLVNPRGSGRKNTQKRRATQKFEGLIR